MQVLLNVIFDLFIRVFLLIINHMFQVCSHELTTCAHTSYQQVAYLSQRYELLVSWGAHVQTDRQHLLQSRHNQRRLNGVELATPFLVPPLLVLSSGLVKEYLALPSETSEGSILHVTDKAAVDPTSAAIPHQREFDLPNLRGQKSICAEGLCLRRSFSMTSLQLHTHVVLFLSTHTAAPLRMSVR